MTPTQLFKELTQHITAMGWNLESVDADKLELQATITKLGSSRIGNSIFHAFWNTPAHSFNITRWPLRLWCKPWTYYEA